MEAAMSDDPILAAIAALGADLHGEIVKTRTDIMERIDRHQARIDQVAQECFVNYGQGEAVHRRIDNTRGEQRDLAEQISGLVRQVRMLRDRVDQIEDKGSAA
jgi:predicted nuclease with TOPRIM domain